MAIYETTNETLQLRIPASGAAVRGSSVTDDVAWISDGNYQLTGLRYAVAGVGSGSSSVNIGKVSVTGSATVASAARLLTADLNFMLSTLGSAPALIGSAALMQFAVNDLLTAHYTGYFPGATAFGNITLTLRRI